MAIVIGYHGCSKDAAHNLVGGSLFAPSNKPYDWLGAGSYFWEDDPVRAFEWAKERRAASPCIVGAAIDLGNCLDLTKRSGIKALKKAYESFRDLQLRRHEDLPVNLAPETGTNPDDRVIRRLDRAVVDHLHALYQAASIADGGQTKEFDTVRAMFREGEPVYETAGFYELTHIQIAVRKPEQVLGVFRVPAHQLRVLGLPLDLYDI